MLYEFRLIVQDRLRRLNQEYRILVVKNKSRILDPWLARRDAHAGKYDASILYYLPPSEQNITSVTIAVVYQQQFFCKKLGPF